MMLTSAIRPTSVKHGVSPQAIGATTEVLSAAIDTKGFSYVAILINGGANAATANDAVAVIKQSATSGGTYAAVTGASIGYAAADDNVTKWGIMKTSALTDGTFIKLSMTGGTGGTWTAGGTVLLFNQRDSVVFPPAVAPTFDIN